MTAPLRILPLVLLLAGSAVVSAQQADPYGYDYLHRRFIGLYENADRDSSNNTGDATLLQIDWSDDFNVVYPELSAMGAWVTNLQRGAYVGADGRTYRWSYSIKLVYTGAGSPVFRYFTKAQETYVDAGGSTAPPKNLPAILPVPAQ